jgi:uncharacterized protein YuzE
MKVTTSKYASYIYIKEHDENFKVAKTKELANGVYLDYDDKGELLGIEILSHIDLEEYND